MGLGGPVSFFTGCKIRLNTAIHAVTSLGSSVDKCSEPVRPEAAGSWRLSSGMLAWMSRTLRSDNPADRTIMQGIDFLLPNTQATRLLLSLGPMHPSAARILPLETQPRLRCHDARAVNELFPGQLHRGG